MRRKAVPIDDAGDAQPEEVTEESNTEELDKTRREGDSPSLVQVLVFCLIFRMINSLLIQTYFNPDEHWQSLEVAHRIVFGYGHLTWEWKEGIRSYSHPLIFAALYKVLAVLRLDIFIIMMKAPRLLQSIFAGVGDFYIYRFSNRIFGKCVANWTLFSLFINWFMFFCITRTFSNCLETALTVMSLYYWPSWKCFSSCHEPSATSRKLALFFAALACAIRPTSAITWLYVGIIHLLEANDRFNFIFFEVVPIGSIVLLMTSLVDRLLYGSWILVPLNFVKFNFLSSGGDYYGTHVWHWYFSQGFPAMLFTFSPYSAVGIWQSREWKLFGLVIWELAVYSILGHKEFRFVLPVLPIALMFSGYALANTNRTKKPDLKVEKAKALKQKHPISTWFCCKKKWLVIFLLATNIPMAFYTSMVHQTERR